MHDMDLETGSQPVERLVQTLGTTSVSVPALLKPADAVAAPIAATPAGQSMAETPVQIAAPTPQPETVVIEPVDRPVVASVPPTAAAPVQDTPARTHHLDAIAGLCTALARVVDRTEIQQLLQEAARELGAIGIIIWTWDTIAEELRPARARASSGSSPSCRR